MSELRDLLHRYQTGEASAADVASLSAMIRTGSAAAREAARWMLMSSDLAETLTEQERGDSPTTLSSTRVPFAVVGLAVAAAVLVTAGAVAIYALVAGEPTEPPKPRVEMPIATLIDANATVVIGDRTGNPGDEYGSGTYSIERGKAQLLLTNRVTVDMRGRTRLTMYSDMRASMTRGTASFRCPTGTEGFTVSLPGGAKVVDLGTAFEVSIDEAGVAIVRVTEGRVKLVTAGDETNPPREIELGAAMSVDVSDRGRVAGPVVTKIKPVGYAYDGELRPGAAPGQGEIPARLDSGGVEMIDGVIGGKDFDTHDWIGVVNPTRRPDVAQPAIVFDLGERRTVSGVAVTYLVDHEPAIHAPSRAVVSFGETPESLGDPVEDRGFDDTPTGRLARDGDVRTHTFRFAPRTARYLRLDLYNDHEWTFISEIELIHETRPTETDR